MKKGIKIFLISIIIIVAIIIIAILLETIVFYKSYMKVVRISKIL